MGIVNCVDCQSVLAAPVGSQPSVSRGEVAGSLRNSKSFTVFLCQKVLFISEFYPISFFLYRCTDFQYRYRIICYNWSQILKTLLLFTFVLPTGTLKIKMPSNTIFVWLPRFFFPDNNSVLTPDCFVACHRRTIMMTLKQISAIVSSNKDALCYLLVTFHVQSIKNPARVGVVIVASKLVWECPQGTEHWEVMTQSFESH